MAAQLNLDDRLTQLFEALGGTPEERRTAKGELIALGSEAVSTLIGAVRSGEGHQSWAAAELLGELADPRALPALVEAMNHENPILGSAAARSLVNFPEWEVADFLIKALPQAPPITQQNIVLSLLQIGDAGVAEPLMEQLDHAESPGLKCVILQALGELGDPAAIPRVRLLLGHDDHHVRQWAETALSQLSAAERR